MCNALALPKASNVPTQNNLSLYQHILSFSKIESNGKIKNLLISIPEKNYTTHTDENENLTHEVAVAPLVPSLRSGRQAQIYKKTPLFFFEEVGVFPNSLSANFCKSLIKSNFGIVLHGNVQLNKK